MNDLHSLPEGYRLRDYRIGACIGSGGFGLIYAATDTMLERAVAMWRASTAAAVFDFPRLSFSPPSRQSIRATHQPSQESSCMLESIRGKGAARAIRAALLSAAALAAAPAPAADRALLIGVGNYRTPGNDLPGIELDIGIMREVAGHLGFRGDQIQVLRDAEATEQGVKRALERWLVQGTASGGRALIYFSGHGARVPDTNGDEEDGADEILVLHDFAVERVEQQTGVAHGAGGFLLDDDFNDYLRRIPAETLVIVDACHSGTSDKGWVATKSFGSLQTVEKTLRYPGMPLGRSSGGILEKGHRPGQAAGTDGYVGLFAAGDDEKAIATDKGSLFTLGLRDAISDYLRRGQQPTPEDLVANARAFIQREAREGRGFNPRIQGDKQLRVRPLPLNAPDPERSPWKKLEDLVRQASGQIAVTPGSARTRIGRDRLTLTIEIPADLPADGGYLNVVEVGENGEQTVLFPNEHDLDNRLPKGEARTFALPTAKFALETYEPVGNNLIAAFITVKPLSLYESGNDKSHIFASPSAFGWSDLAKSSADRPGVSSVGQGVWAGLTHVEVVR